MQNVEREVAASPDAAAKRTHTSQAAQLRPAGAASPLSPILQKMLVILSRYGVAVPRIHIRSASCLTRGCEALPASPGVQSSAVGKRQRRRGASLGVRSTPCPFAARAGDADRLMPLAGTPPRRGAGSQRRSTELAPAAWTDCWCT